MSAAESGNSRQVMNRDAIRHSSGAKAGHKTVEELQAAVYRYSLSLTGSSWDAEDLVQDAWLKALQVFREKEHANPEALLVKIAKTTWFDHLRRRRTWEEIVAKLGCPPATGEGGALEMEEALLALLKHLSPLQSKVWLLREVLELPAKETAELLQMSEGAVKAALHRARQQLHAVRRELETGPAASGESSRQWDRELAALAAAIQTGNIASLLHLLHQAELRSAAAAGTAVMAGPAPTVATGEEAGAPREAAVQASLSRSPVPFRHGLQTTGPGSSMVMAA